MYSLEPYLNRYFNWSQDYIRGFENDRRFGIHRSFCATGIFLPLTNETTKYPVIVKEFQEPSICAADPEKLEETNKELADQIMHHGLNLMSELLGRK